MLRCGAELVDTAACTHGGQPEPVLDGDADRAVQLVRGGGHRTDSSAHRHLRRRHSVIGCGEIEAVVARRGDRQSGCGAGPFDLARHGCERMLHSLKLVSGRPNCTRSPVCATVRSYAASSTPTIWLQRAHAPRRVSSSATPTSTARVSATAMSNVNDPCLAGQVVAVADLRIRDQGDMQRIGRPRRQYDGVKRPRHLGGGSADPAVLLGGVGDRHRQRAAVGHRKANLAGKSRREQIGLGDGNRGRMSGQAGAAGIVVSIARAGVRASGASVGWPAQPAQADRAAGRIPLI